VPDVDGNDVLVVVVELDGAVVVRGVVIVVVVVSTHAMIPTVT
jgi:hypothetical protein